MATTAGEQQQQQQQRPGAATTSSSSSTRAETGFYCSTSGTYFSDKESLAEHYKSDFHRYNLKRKVAGLPPVTKDWFDARKAQLSTAAAAPHTKVWYDPLTKKKFMTQQTYQAHVNSKKYQQLVRDSGEPAPAPIIMVRQLQQQPEVQDSNNAAGGSSSTTTGTAAAAPGGGAQKPAGFTVKAPARPSGSGAAANGAAEADEDGDESSGWETASESDAAADEDAEGAAAEGAAAVDGQQEGEGEGEDEDWSDWDPCISFFDNKVSASMEENLRYMYRKFGFFLPDAEYLADPEGLIKYLGAKLSYGKVPLYTPGDDPNAKQFRSLHAVQRHMVDTNQCRMLFDGNEEEYEDFYDYSAANNAAEEPAGAAAADEASPAAASSTTAAAADGQQQLALALDGLSLGDGGAAGGWELTIPSQGPGGGSKILGSRELARYYRQRPKPQDNRRSVIVNTIIAQYRSLGLATKTSTPPVLQRAAQRQQQAMAKRQQYLLYSRNNVNFNLPKNVTY